MLKKLFSICLICLGGVTGWTQEFNCKVTVRHDKITGVDNQVFINMEKAINEFINQKKWTSDEFAPSEKIDCNILLNLTSNNVNGDVDAYGATMSIQATRPVYNSTYTSTLINYVDKDIIFRYLRTSSLNFDDNAVTGTDPIASNLSAVLAYYSYLVLGLDYDSFSPNGGSNFYKKAQNVVNNSPEGKGITGWKAVENTRNRYWIVDQLLNSRFGDVRTFWYMMHREGLDSMYTKPVESRTRILVNLRKLYNVNRENPSSILMQFLFNAKSDEIIHLLAQAPKQERGQYITLLTAIDVPNAAKYNNYR
jgi:Domain of unknown function (DUF4835)